MESLLGQTEPLVTSAPLLFVKSTLLLLAAMVVVRIWRRASAAAHHVIWASAIAGAVLLPFFTLSLPPWRVAYAARPPVSVIKAAPPETIPSQEPVASAPIGSQQSPLGKIADPPIVAVSPAARNASAYEHTSPAMPSLVRAKELSWFAPWPAIVAFVWVFGSLLTLARFVFGLSLVARARRHSVALDSRTARIASEVHRHSRVMRRVDVRRSANGGVLVPITWGVMRPVVLLPAASDAWSEEWLRTVLLHEFAHIGRGDWLTHCLGRLACALYWWNPMVWFASHQMREASERACDDCVLRAGIAPTEYAQRLVDVLKSLPQGARPRTAAIAMALPRETEGRIRAILASNRNRRTVNSRRMLVAVILSLAVVPPLSALRPMARANAAVPTLAASGESVVPALAPSGEPAVPALAPSGEPAVPALAASGEPAAHRLSRGILQFVYLKDVVCQRDPNRPITMSIVRDAAGGDQYRFTDRRTGQEFEAGAQLPADASAGRGAPSSTLALRKQAQAYNRWSALLYDSPIVVTDADIVKAEARMGGASRREPTVAITFSPEGAQKLAEYTAGHFGEIMGIMSDGALLTAPTVMTTITDGKCELSLNFHTLGEAQTLAARLNAPAATEVTSPALYRHTLANGATVLEIRSGWGDPAQIAHAYQATLSDGAHVQIDSLTEDTDYIKKQNMTLGAMWSPDGVYLNRRWTPGKYGGASISERQNPSKIITYTVGPAVGDASLYTEVLGGVQADAPTIVRRDVSSQSALTLIQTLYFPKAAKTFSMRIGVARQPWRTIASLPARVNTAASIAVKGLMLGGADIEIRTDDRPSLISSIRFGAMSLNPFLTSGRSLPNVARRIVAVDASGTALPLNSTFRDRRGVVYYGLSYNRSSLLAKRNPRLNLANTVRFELQTRPYEVVEFRNISLHPEVADLPMTPAERARRVAWAYLDMVTKHNMSLIGLAIYQYETEHNDKLPDFRSLPVLRRTLAAYIADQEKKIDPKTGLPNRAIGSDVFVSPITGKPYRFDPALSGRWIGTFYNPTEQILFRDDVSTPPYASVKWETVAFLDTHVKGRGVVTRP